MNTGYNLYTVILLLKYSGTTTGTTDTGTGIIYYIYIIRVPYIYYIYIILISGYIIVVRPVIAPPSSYQIFMRKK